MTPEPSPPLTTVLPAEEETADPSPPKTVDPEIRDEPSHLAGETVTPSTEASCEEAESMTALSALEAKTSIAGREKRGIGGISPGRYPGTVATDEAVAEAVGVGVGASVVASGAGAGVASAFFGLEDPQAPRARVAAVITAAAVRVRRVMVMVQP